MANQEHLDILLKQGVEAWNKWRAHNPRLKPDLQGADLSEPGLQGADLSEADLSEADLFKAILIRANLTNANLTEA
jgi:uncharacterized protein YjbI with pentapeptide repeats